jgi:pimeloyl-ACP methyl ester carboxylesterase
VICLPLVNEEFCKVGDVELCYETFGEPGKPAVLLIMGLGTQMIGWHEQFCAQLVERGYFVIRYDNRDCGRSTHFDQIPPPSIWGLLFRRPKPIPYTLGDMADDAVGLLDHLGIEKAHLVGASMGAMIGQMVAIKHPERTLSLASIMGSTGSRWSGQPAMRVLPAFIAKAKPGKEAYVERIVKLFKLVGSRGFPIDDADLRAIASLSWDRGVSEAGLFRQFAAIIATGSRVKDLRKIRVPTVVIHGTVDKLVKPSGGKATAKAIAGSKLVMINGMGHDLPRGAWPQILGEIEQNAQRAGQPTAQPAQG